MGKSDSEFLLRLNELIEDTLDLPVTLGFPNLFDGHNLNYGIVEYYKKTSLIYEMIYDHFRGYSIYVEDKRHDRKDRYFKIELRKINEFCTEWELVNEIMLYKEGHEGEVEIR